MSIDSPKPSRRGALDNGFVGMSNEAGVAVLPNVPVSIKQFGVGHTHYVLPKVKTRTGSHRYAAVSLSTGMTNRVSVTLEPKEVDPLQHY